MPSSAPCPCKFNGKTKCSVVNYSIRLQSCHHVFWICCSVWLKAAVIYRYSLQSLPQVEPRWSFIWICHLSLHFKVCVHQEPRGSNGINTWDYLESPDSLYLGLFNLLPYSMDSFWHHFALNEVCPSLCVRGCAQAWAPKCICLSALL